MKQITLVGVGVGDALFDVDHAQRVLDFQKKNPPTVWKISPNEKNYVISPGVPGIPPNIDPIPKGMITTADSVKKATPVVPSIPNEH